MRYAAVLCLTLVSVAVFVAAAPKPGFGELFFDDTVVRTVVPPAASPKRGVDDLYVITGGAKGQLPVAAVAPGKPGYHGGKWAFHEVKWNTTPTLLKSAAAVLAAANAKDVTITRQPEKDFKCPIQP